MPEPATRSDARTNRRRLLAAAVEAFAASGIDAEIREIAERSGLSVGAVYRHFPSKEDLIAAVIDQAVTEFERALTDALACPDTLSGLSTFVRGSLDVTERYGEPISAVLEGRARLVRNALYPTERRAAIRRQLAELVARGIEAGVFRPDLDAEVATAMLRFMFVPQSLAELRQTRGPEQIVETIVALFIHGAGRAPTTARIGRS